MLVELKFNKNKADEWNQRIDEFKKEYPEFSLSKITKLTDKFIPYSDVMENLDDKYTKIETDYRSTDEFSSVYVCHLNANYDLERMTNYQEKKNFDSPIYWCDYGVADNASQVLDYYYSLYEQNKEYMKEQRFIIMLTPIFKEDQPENGGWRWHKWGQYIGKFEPENEYLFDETGIDYVYCFKILEVKENR